MLEVDWGIERPDPSRIDAVWQDASFDVVALQASAVEEFVGAMAETRPRGDARCCCVQIPESPVIDWFAARNCLADAGFFGHLLGAPTIAAELDLDVSDAPEPTMTVESSLSLDGVLAEELVYGGSVSYVDTAAEADDAFARAKRLAERFRDLVVEERYEEVTVHRTREPWCEWFGEPTWNLTLVAVDRRHRWAWVLVATDEGCLE